MSPVSPLLPKQLEVGSRFCTDFERVFNANKKFSATFSVHQLNDIGW